MDYNVHVLEVSKRTDIFPHKVNTCILTLEIFLETSECNQILKLTTYIKVCELIHRKIKLKHTMG